MSLILLVNNKALGECRMQEELLVKSIETQENIKSQLEEKDLIHVVDDGAQKEEVIEGGTSAFILQLLVCSLLLWSLIFLKAQPSGQTFLNEVNKKVVAPSNLTVITEIYEAFIDVVEEVV